MPEQPEKTSKPKDAAERDPSAQSPKMTVSSGRSEKTSPAPKDLKDVDPRNLEGMHMAATDALRNHFAGIALAEIVKWQVAQHKGGQEDVAASWAYRYADRMLDESKKHPKGRPQNVKGVLGVAEDQTQPAEEPQPIVEVS